MIFANWKAGKIFGFVSVHEANKQEEAVVIVSSKLGKDFKKET